MAASSLCTKFALNNKTPTTIVHQYSTAQWEVISYTALFSQTFYSDIYFTTKYQRLISLQSLHYIDMIFPSRKCTHKQITEWKKKMLRVLAQLGKLPQNLQLITVAGPEHLTYGNSWFSIHYCEINWIKESTVAWEESGLWIQIAVGFNLYLFTCLLSDLQWIVW